MKKLFYFLKFTQIAPPREVDNGDGSKTVTLTKPTEEMGYFIGTEDEFWTMIETSTDEVSYGKMYDNHLDVLMKSKNPDALEYQTFMTTAYLTAQKEGDVNIEDYTDRWFTPAKPIIMRECEVCYNEQPQSNDYCRECGEEFSLDKTHPNAMFDIRTGMKIASKEEYEQMNKLERGQWKEAIMQDARQKTALMRGFDTDSALQRRVDEFEKEHRDAGLPAKEPSVQQKLEDELETECMAYMKAVVDMSDVDNIRNVMGAEERRTKHHNRITELSGLDRQDVGAGMNAKALGLPEHKLYSAYTKTAERQVIAIDYGYKLFQWIKWQMNKKKSEENED